MKETFIIMFIIFIPTIISACYLISTYAPNNIVDENDSNLPPSHMNKLAVIISWIVLIIGILLLSFIALASVNYISLR